MLSSKYKWRATITVNRIYHTGNCSDLIYIDSYWSLVDRCLGHDRCPDAQLAFRDSWDFVLNPVSQRRLLLHYCSIGCLLYRVYLLGDLGLPDATAALLVPRMLSAPLFVLSVCPKTSGCLLLHYWSLGCLLHSSCFLCVLELQQSLAWYLNLAARLPVRCLPVCIQAMCSGQACRAWTGIFEGRILGTVVLAVMTWFLLPCRCCVCFVLGECV